MFGGVFMPWYGLLALTTVSGLVQSLTGFGAGIVMMLFLPSFFTMLQAPALSCAICLGLTAPMAWKFRAYIQPKLILPPLIAYEVGAMTTLNFVSRLDLGVLGIAFGAFLIILSLYFLFLSKNITVQPSLKSAAVCGTLSGICNGLFGIGGPMMAIYFLAITDTKESYSGNQQCLFFITTIINLIIRMQKGFYTLDLIPFTLIGMVGIGLGMRIGLKILSRINSAVLKKIIYAFVGISGIITMFDHL